LLRFDHNRLFYKSHKVGYLTSAHGSQMKRMLGWDYCTGALV